MIFICNDCGNKGQDEGQAFGFVEPENYDKPFEPAPRKCLLCGSWNCRTRRRESIFDAIAFILIIILIGIPMLIVNGLLKITGKHK